MKKRTPVRETVSDGGEVGTSGDRMVQEGLSDREPELWEKGGFSNTVSFVRGLDFFVFLLFSLVHWDSCSLLLFFKLKSTMKKSPWKIWWHRLWATLKWALLSVVCGSHCAYYHPTTEFHSWLFTSHEPMWLREGKSSFFILCCEMAVWRASIP